MNLNMISTQHQSFAPSDLRRPEQTPRTSPVAIERPGTHVGAESFGAALQMASHETGSVSNNVALDEKGGFDPRYFEANR